MATVAAYDALIEDQLVNRMFGMRLAELIDQPVRPFLGAQAGGRPSSGDTKLCRGCRQSRAEPVDTTRLLATEIERARRFGFTSEELDAAKQAVLRQYAEADAERNTSESASLADELGRHFLTDEPVPGIAWENQRVKTAHPLAHRWRR